MSESSETNSINKNTENDNKLSYYTTTYKKKDGTITTHKKVYKLKGSKKTGRKLTIKGQILNELKGLDDEKLREIYNLIKALNLK